ncbi:hypothetical protein [Nocardioides sp.]|jgi:hypothetical protein|uniref:hypothetical protein n=1 Tax=Nocardioides sp. TaxID=35761 RepID=UPI002CCF9518|nr:hypothetical protein [Nocardioides sp.]HVX54764.1 hypothetical protein [Nocardioides sp.]
MKKLIAGLFTALALTLGLVTVAGTAPASADQYGPAPVTTNVVKQVNKAVKAKGHIKAKKAKKLIKKVKAAKKAGLISKAKAKKLIKKIKKDEK